MELPTSVRSSIAEDINAARRKRLLKHEFDPRRRPSLQTVSELRLGVQCAIGHSNGASTFWRLPGRDERPQDLLREWSSCFHQRPSIPRTFG